MAPSSCYQKNMKKISLFLILFCFSLFLVACKEQPKIAAKGSPAPDFTLVDLQGKTWTLSELKGQVIFVNFWATWCPPCVEEMPSMQRLYTMLPKDKFKMLAILNSDEPAIAKAFSEKFGITIPILDDQQNIIGPKYGITGVPETFIIDRQGIIREKFIGPAEWNTPAATQMVMNYINQ